MSRAYLIAAAILIGTACEANDPISVPAVSPDYSTLDHIVAADYEVVELGLPIPSNGFDVNLHGEVVGWAANNGFFWTEATGATYLPAQYLVALNDAGDVVSGTGTVFWHDGTTTDIAGPNQFVWIYAMNNSGQVVGRETVNNITRPFVWSKATGFTFLEGLGGPAIALDINDHGQVVGFSATGEVASVGPWTVPVTKAVLWDEDGNATALESVDGGVLGPRAMATAINNIGHVAGMLQMGGAANLERFFVWTPESGTEVIAPFAAEGYNNQIYVEGINDRGEVTGFIWQTYGMLPLQDPTLPGEGVMEAFVWKDGRLSYLPNLPDGGSTRAYGISESGYIVGYAGGLATEGTQKAVVWKPTP